MDGQTDNGKTICPPDISLRGHKKSSPFPPDILYTKLSDFQRLLQARLSIPHGRQHPVTLITFYTASLPSFSGTSSLVCPDLQNRINMK